MDNIHLKKRYIDEEATPVVSFYPDGNAPALYFKSLDDEPLATASVNIWDVSPKSDHIIIKDWSENEGMVDCLINLGFIGPADGFHPTGYVVASEHPMLGKLLEEWHRVKEEHGI